MILSLLLLTQPVPAFAASAPAVQAEAAVVMSGDGGVLYAKNADTRRLIASSRSDTAAWRARPCI